VRASLIDFSLFSRLHFDKEGAGYTLYDIEPGVAGKQSIVKMIRPPKTAAFWIAQLNIVASWADLRAERCSEILSQLTPPIAYWSAIANLHPERHKWTLELLWTALRLANHAEMRFKHALACRRAVEMSPQVQPLVLTPGHGSLPSGHSTEASIVAHVLWRLLKTADNTKDFARRRASRSTAPSPGCISRSTARPDSCWA
jgi:hypothetical protein